MLGAEPDGIPACTPEYVNTLRPAVVLGRGVSRRGSVLLSSGRTWYFLISA